MVAPAATKTTKKASNAPVMKKVKNQTAQKMKMLAKVATNIASTTTTEPALVYTAISPASSPDASPAKPHASKKWSQSNQVSSTKVTGQSSTRTRRPRITINMRTGRCTIHEHTDNELVQPAFTSVQPTTI